MTSPAKIGEPIRDRVLAKIRAIGDEMGALHAEIDEAVTVLRSKRSRMAHLRGELETLSRSRTLQAEMFEGEEPQPWPASYGDVPLARLGLSTATLNTFALLGATKLGDVFDGVRVKASLRLTPVAERELDDRMTLLMAEHPNYAAQRDREEDATA